MNRIAKIKITVVSLSLLSACGGRTSLDIGAAGGPAGGESSSSGGASASASSSSGCGLPDAPDAGYQDPGPLYAWGEVCPEPYRAGGAVDYTLGTHVVAVIWPVPPGGFHVKSAGIKLATGAWTPWHGGDDVPCLSRAFALTVWGQCDNLSVGTPPPGAATWNFDDIPPDPNHPNDPSLKSSWAFMSLDPKNEIDAEPGTYLVLELQLSRSSDPEHPNTGGCVLGCPSGLPAGVRAFEGDSAGGPAAFTYPSNFSPFMELYDTLYDAP